jgi:Holliday junction resolvase RusA-like endonuclease
MEQKQINFFIRCNPPKTTAQAHRKATVINNRAMIYVDAEGKQLENDYISLLMPYVPQTPYYKSIIVDVLFVFPWRKSEKKSVVQYHYVPHIAKPDRDNAVKTLFDVMSMLRFWTDDDLISDGRITKVWGDEPGIGICIRESPQSFKIELTDNNGIVNWNLNEIEDNSKTISD